MLSRFPLDAKTLDEGTISIGSQTWTSTQIRFDSEDMGEEGIATLAVTNKDSAGYYLIAIAPYKDWNTVQPVFQGMINSFRFGAETVVAKATTTPKKATRAATEEAEEAGTATEEETEDRSGED